MAKPAFYSHYCPDTPVMRGWPFRIRSLGYNNYAPFAKFPSGSHPEDHLFSWESGRVLQTLTLVHVTGGKGRFRSKPSGTLPVPRNTVIFVFPQIRHAYCPDRKTGWNNQWVEFDAAHALPLLKQAGIVPEQPLKTFEATPHLSRLFQELQDLSRAEAFGVEQELSACAHRIFAHVLALWQGDTSQAQHFAAVERLRQFLVTDQKHVRSVADASEQAGLSAPRLRVLFKQATGLSPKQYQLEARMDRAARLLADSALPVGAIAEQAGYDSIYHFSRQFKLTCGVSPSRYRAGHAAPGAGG
jgi:AraC-like DNA-binding protein